MNRIAMVVFFFLFFLVFTTMMLSFVSGETVVFLIDGFYSSACAFERRTREALV